MSEKRFIKKRVTVGFAYSTPQEYHRLVAIADNEGRRLSNLIEWWMANCAAAYERIDSRGAAYVQLRLNPLDLPKDSEETAPCKILAFPKSTASRGGA